MERHEVPNLIRVARTVIFHCPFSILHLILRVNTGGIRAQNFRTLLIAVLRCAGQHCRTDVLLQFVQLLRVHAGQEAHLQTDQHIGNALYGFARVDEEGRRSSSCLLRGKCGRAVRVHSGCVPARALSSLHR